MKPIIIKHPLGDHPPTATLYYGISAYDALPLLPDESIQCCVTSPPYWGLRDYGTEEQLGLEPTPDLYIEHLVAIFQQVRRVLRTDGTLWLNLGDTYAASQIKQIKPKDLVGIPWRVALALQKDGWWLRQDIVWHKPVCMPESVQDRCTRSHEFVFMLTKTAQYHFDSNAIREPLTTTSIERAQRFNAAKKKYGSPEKPTSKHRSKGSDPSYSFAGLAVGRSKGYDLETNTRNKRSVWSINPQPYKGAHFATMPEKLAETCLKATGRKNATVLDPFSGSATTGAVALRLGMNYIGIDLNLDYLPLAEARLLGDPAPDHNEPEPDQNVDKIDDILDLFGSPNDGDDIDED